MKTSYSQGRIRKCVQIRSQLLHMKQHPLVCRLSHFVHAKSSCLRIKIYLCKMQGCMLMFCTQNPDSSGVLHVESQFLKFKSLFFACVCKPNSGFQIDSIHMCKPNHQSCMCNICIYIYIICQMLCLKVKSPGFHIFLQVTSRSFASEICTCRTVILKILIAD